MPAGILQHLNQRLILTVTLGFCLGLGGCQPLDTSSTTPSPKIAASANDHMSTKTVNALLDQAMASQSPQKEHYLLDAAQALYLLKDTTQARNLLASINSDILDTPRLVQYSLLFSEIAMAGDAYFLAQRILTNPRLEQQWQALNTADTRTLRERRAQLFDLLGETEASVAERQTLQHSLTNPAERNANNDALWQTLMTLPHAELEQRANSNDNAELRGWYSLAAISKNSQTNLELQQAQVDQWIATWPTHPASMRLPEDLQLLQELINERPSQIALLLPRQGELANAGNAIRDGFLAAYYRAKALNNSTPDVRIYDTSRGDFLLTYQKAVDDGAKLIIGPLEKDNVTLLATLDTLPVPTLAVNYTETESGTEPAQGLYQFGLAVEDEARQTAQRAWLEGYRHPLILMSESNWGERSAKAFTDEWRKLGGTVSAQSRFRDNGDFSGIIKNVLLLKDSENRAAALRRLFGQNVEFEPRRREDIDMIYLIARPVQARQIKPTLAYHYAGNLPVYASSHIYSGVPDRKSDIDLNDIRFSTLPWLFDTQSAEKKAIRQVVNPAPGYQQLYALGVDSYRLYPRLRQLEEIPEARLYGVTGSLQLNDQRQIERQQIWASFNNGLPRPLPTVVTDNIIN